VAAEPSSVPATAISATTALSMVARTSQLPTVRRLVSQKLQAQSGNRVLDRSLTLATAAWRQGWVPRARPAPRLAQLNLSGSRRTQIVPIRVLPPDSRYAVINIQIGGDEGASHFEAGSLTVTDSQDG
jgi:hypothetical protein